MLVVNTSNHHYQKFSPSTASQTTSLFSDFRHASPAFIQSSCDLLNAQSLHPYSVCRVKEYELPLIFTISIPSPITPQPQYAPGALLDYRMTYDSQPMR